MARLVVLAGILSVCCATLARAEVTVRDPGTRVVDQAKIIEPAVRQRLEDYLAELERKTSAQIKVLTIRTADGEDIADFGQRHYELWKLGQKGKDNGALVVIDVNEHKIRIHTGYGLEGPLPDSWCGSLWRKVRDQYFKAGRYSDGINELTVALANKVADDAGVKLEGVPEIRHDPPDHDDITATLVLVVFAVIFLLLLFNSMRRQHHRRVWTGDLYDVWYWGRVLGDVGVSVLSSGSGSSGGSSGFGGGGGSFGGGGSSGGGGVSGSW